MKEVNAKEIYKINVEKEEDRKPYVVYLPEEEANKIVKRKIPVSTTIVVGMLAACLIVLVIGHIVENRR